MSSSALPVPTSPAAAASGERLRLGLLHIDVVTFAQALERIEALVAARRGGSVFTPNVDHVVNVESDALFAEAHKSGVPSTSERLARA